MVTFKNLYAPNRSYQPLIDDSCLWNMYSDLVTNISSWENLDSFKALLANYIPRDERGEVIFLQNMRKIDALIDISIESDDMLYQHTILHGLKIQIGVKSHDFESMGACYLFGCILDQLFAAHTAINSYTYLHFRDSYSGVITSWKPKLGTRTLI